MGRANLNKQRNSSKRHGSAKMIMLLRKSALKYRSHAPPGKRRVGLLRYLARVYGIYLDLRSKRTLQAATREIAELAGIRVRKGAHPIRLLIDASSGPEDPKQKSRWVAALRYLEGWQLPPEKVRWAFNQNGGVYGCARKYAALNKAARRRPEADLF